MQVLEATAQAGGSVRSAELTLPGFRNDVFSAFYALGAAAPILRRLELERSASCSAASARRSASRPCGAAPAS